MQLATGTITLVGLLFSYYIHLIETYRGQQNIDFWLLTVLRQSISLQDRYMAHMQNIRHSKFKYKGTKKVFSLLALWNSSQWTHLNSSPIRPLSLQKGEIYYRKM